MSAHQSASYAEQCQTPVRFSYLYLLSMRVLRRLHNCSRAVGKYVASGCLDDLHQIFLGIYIAVELFSWKTSYCIPYMSS